MASDDLFENNLHLFCMKIDNFENEIQGWDKLFESNTTRIYRKFNEGVRLYEYKILTCMPNVGPDVCYKVYMDIDYRKKWDTYVKELYAFREDGEDCIYWEVKYPFPATNRDARGLVKPFFVLNAAVAGRLRKTFSFASYLKLVTCGKMKFLQFVLHLSVVLFHQCQAQFRDDHCKPIMSEGRAYCVDATADQLANELNRIVDGTTNIRDLSIRESDVSAFLNLNEYPNVEKLELDSVRMGDSAPISLPQLLSKFPSLQLLQLDNSKEKIKLTRETFMPGQPILTLIFSNDGLTDEDIDIDAFENIKPTLKALILRENQLTYLPSAISGLPDLRDLDFTGNHIKYFSDATTKQLKSLPQLQSINVNDLDCHCDQLRETFYTYLKEKRITLARCSPQSNFPEMSVPDIDLEENCKISTPKPETTDEGPDGSNQMKVAVLALIVTVLPLYLK